MKPGWRQTTVVGGTLFRVAANHLGSALEWNRIALANGLTDPWNPLTDGQINGVVTLKIPPRDPRGGNGGILGPE